MQTRLKKHLAIVIEFPRARAQVRSRQRAAAAIVGVDQIAIGDRESSKPGSQAKNYENLMRLAHLSLLQAEILAFKANEQLNSQFEAKSG